jgi:hypothetical protein
VTKEKRNETKPKENNKTKIYKNFQIQIHVVWGRAAKDFNKSLLSDII